MFSTKERATTAFAQSKLEVHVTGPIRPGRSDVKLIVETRNRENIVQRRGPVVLSAAADASLNLSKSSCRAHFFVTTNIRQIGIQEMTAQL